jgi:hypothetical protein
METFSFKIELRTFLPDSNADQLIIDAAQILIMTFLKLYKNGKSEKRQQEEK